MENKKRTVSHSGIVTAVSRSSITVKIQAVSACASCSVHAKCGFADTKDKEMEIPVHDTNAFSVDQPVNVFINEGNGLWASAVAYVAPAVLLIAVVLILSHIGLVEWAVALSALASMALYVGFLWLIRPSIDRRIQLSVQPL